MTKAEAYDFFFTVLMALGSMAVIYGACVGSGGC